MSNLKGEVLVSNYFMKRPVHVENDIMRKWEPSVVHENAFTLDETKQLINIFKKAPKTTNMTEQNKMFDDFLNKDSTPGVNIPRPKAGEASTACSAPVCWEEGASEILHPILTKCIGNYKIVGGTFNLTMGPYRLHTDSGRHEDSRIYKQIIIPLFWDKSLPVYSILYDQRWTGCQARFQRGVASSSDEKFTTSTHMTITDYENSPIYNLTNEPFDKSDYENFVSHINYESLWGFSIEMAAKWTPQSLISYDRCVIHSSCHFARQELKNKLFLTLVTES